MSYKMSEQERIATMLAEALHSVDRFKKQRMDAENLVFDWISNELYEMVRGSNDAENFCKIAKSLANRLNIDINSL